MRLSGCSKSVLKNPMPFWRASRIASQIFRFQTNNRSATSTHATSVRNMAISNLQLETCKSLWMPIQQYQKTNTKHLLVIRLLNTTSAIRLFFTTKRLLSIALKANHIAIDPTYKLVWQNYPIIQVGYTDKTKALSTVRPSSLRLGRRYRFRLHFQQLVKTRPWFSSHDIIGRW